MTEIIPINKRIFSQPFVIVGVIIEKDGKFLLVQEAKKDVGKWNQPAGWLDLNEDLIAGAKREAEEETGAKIEITGFLGVYSYTRKPGENYNHVVKFIFSAKVLSGIDNTLKDEVMDVKWFTLEDAKDLGEKLRSPQIIDEIEDFVAGKIYPLDIIKSFIDYTK